MIDKGGPATRSPCRRHAGEPYPPKSFATGTGVLGRWRCQVESPRSSVLGAEWSKWTTWEGLGVVGDFYLRFGITRRCDTV
jgi:hypothetical protein